jgi:hypothetical protein
VEKEEQTNLSIAHVDMDFCLPAAVSRGGGENGREKQRPPPRNIQLSLF